MSFCCSLKLLLKPSDNSASVTSRSTPARAVDTILPMTLAISFMSSSLRSPASNVGESVWIMTGGRLA
jgi:hypothetical protein